MGISTTENCYIQASSILAKWECSSIGKPLDLLLLVFAAVFIAILIISFKKDFSIVRILILVVLLVIISAGLFTRIRNYPPSLPTKLPKLNIKFAKDEFKNISNSSDLILVYDELVSENKLKRCHYFDNCFDGVFTEDTKEEIARKYGVVEASSNKKDISVGLIKGGSADVTGLGVGYIKNKAFLNLDDNTWYWEIGACSTNNRIYINAITGKAGPLHSYVYCGGIP